MPSTAEKLDPQLWEEAKADARDAYGGHSARAMQYASKLYKARGGRYKGRKRADNRLTQWTRQDWTTKSGRPSRETGERYLPRAAIESLSSAEYGATSRAKRRGGGVGSIVAQPQSIREKTRKFRKVNPIMAKSATPAQIAARKKFAQRARSGELARMRKKSAPKKARAVKSNPSKIKWIKEIDDSGFNNPPQYNASYRGYDGTVFKENGKWKIQINKDNRFVGEWESQTGTIPGAKVWLEIVADTDLNLQLPPGNEMRSRKRNPTPTKARAVKSNPSSKNIVMKNAVFEVIKWKRGKNTVYGNPVYEFILMNLATENEFIGKTKPNASFVFRDGNRIREGDTVVATLEKTPSGRVYMTDIFKYEGLKSNPAATRAPARSRTKLVSNGREKNPIQGYTVMCGRSGRILGYADTLPMAKAMATSIANDRNMQVKIEKN